jgi:cytochrome c oxidase assembly factor CtaG
MPVSSDLVVALMHAAGEPGSLTPAAVAAWTIEPGVAIPLFVAAGLYTVGVVRLWRAGGRGAGIRVWQASCFGAGCAAVVAALMSPIDTISTELSSAHMVQHELLMIVAAPLLVAGVPLVAMLCALPQPIRGPIARTMRTRWLSVAWAVLSAPATVWILHAIALWTWHIPVFYEAALRSEAVHALEHACFFGTAALFWWGITRGRYGRIGYGAAVIYVFATALHSGMLGAALTVSPSVWYPIYAATTPAWGMTPLEDQQLAGLIMWVPAGLVFTAVGLLYFAAWLKESEKRSRFGRAAAAACVLIVAGAMMQACGPDVSAEAAAMTGGDPDRGRDAIARYGCDTCHTIPGVRTARGRVGPPLDGIASRVYIAGHLPNTPENLQDWIQHPHAHDPQTVMPETGITARDTRDVAAYLYTLR